MEYAQNPCMPLPGLVHENPLHNALSCLLLPTGRRQRDGLVLLEEPLLRLWGMCVCVGGGCRGRVELHGRLPSHREHAHCILLD